MILVIGGLKFDTRSAIRDYVDWLKAGNPK